MTNTDNKPNRKSSAAGTARRHYAAASCAAIIIATLALPAQAQTVALPGPGFFFVLDPAGTNIVFINDGTVAGVGQESAGSGHRRRRIAF